MRAPKPRVTTFFADGPDVTIRVGLLRVGDIHLVGVNGEIYTNIGLGVKEASPARKTLVVSLANGSAGSGYIYSDDAYHHLTSRSSAHG